MPDSLARTRAAREWGLFLAAIQMLTRVPVRTAPPQPDWLARSAKFFPLVGALVGVASGMVLWGASQLWPQPVPALLALATAILLTGGLHEDGLADTADSAGGWTRERRLAIMKDSRIGTYGVLALGIVLGLKVAALAQLPAAAAVAALAASGAVSRALAVVVMSRTAYAGDLDRAKVDHGIDGPRAGEVAVAIVFALVPLFWLGLVPCLAGLVLAILTGSAVAMRNVRAFGGHTGDVLGAVTATAEAAFLLGVAMRLPW